MAVIPVSKLYSNGTLAIASNFDETISITPSTTKTYSNGTLVSSFFDETMSISPSVSKLYSNGAISVSGKFDEVTNNPTVFGSLNTFYNDTNTCIILPNSNNYNFSTGDFTFETWVYLHNPISASSPYGGGIASLSYQYGASGRTSWIASLTYNSGDANSSFFTFVTTTDGNSNTLNSNAYYSTHTTPIKRSNWTHLAASRSGSNLYLSVDGNVQSFTISSAALYNNSTDPFIIGSYSYTSRNSSLFMFLGKLSNLKIVKGAALYTSNFTPQLVPSTADSNTVLLLNTLYVDPFKDSSQYNVTYTSIGNTTPESFTPFNPPGYNSIYCNSTSGAFSVITNATPSFQLNNSDFTIETYIYPTSLSKTILDTRTSNTSINGIVLQTRAGANIQLTANGTNYFGSGANVITNTWNHVAVTRSSNVFSVWVNGVKAITQNLGVTLSDQANWLIGAGQPGTSNGYIGAYFSNFRVVTGQALYSNTFTPSTKPLLPIANTILLTAQSNKYIDNSTSNINVIAVSNSIYSDLVSNNQPFKFDFSNTGLS
jgi:hypothetical protein